VRRIALFATFAFLTVFPAALRAEDPAPGAEEIQRLVLQLGHDDFRTREEASRRLTEIGEPARSTLEDALKHSESPEVRWRAEQLLRRLEGRKSRPLGVEPGAPAPMPTPGEDEPPEDPDDALGGMRRRLEQMQREFERLFGRPLPTVQLGFVGRVEVPGLVFERRVPQGVVLHVTSTDEAGNETTKDYEGTDLEDVLRRNPDLAAHPGMEELKRRVARTSLPGFDDLFKEGLPGIGFRTFPGGFTSFQSQGVEVTQDASGATVRIRERGEDGKEVVREYKGETLDDIKREHPEIADRLGGMSVHVSPPQFFFGGRARRGLQEEQADPRSAFGVMLEAPSAALSSHLKLRAGQGAVIAFVFPDSQAAKMGVQTYDVILRLNGQDVGYGPGLQQALRAAAAAPGSPLEIEALRAGEPLTLKR